MHFKLIAPAEPSRVFAVPENAGFHRALVSLLQELEEQELEERGHTFELVDSGTRPLRRRPARVRSL